MDRLLAIALSVKPMYHCKRIGVPCPRAAVGMLTWHQAIGAWSREHGNQDILRGY
jgi:hypothetical protein